MNTDSNIFILSMPRTDSSVLANLVQSAGYNAQINSDSLLLTSLGREVTSISMYPTWEV